MMSKPKSKTEELSERIDKALCDFVWNYKTATIYKPHLRNQERENKRDLAVNQILKACKDAGLAFVDREARYPCVLMTPAEEAVLNRNGWYKTEGIDEQAKDRRDRCAQTLQGRALLTIDHILSELESEDKLLEKLYRIAHCATGVCPNPHEDWVKELEEDCEKLK